jgi:hypothetical protein
VEEVIAVLKVCVVNSATRGTGSRQESSGTFASPLYTNGIRASVPGSDWSMAIGLGEIPRLG